MHKSLLALSAIALSGCTSAISSIEYHKEQGQISVTELSELSSEGLNFDYIVVIEGYSGFGYTTNDLETRLDVVRELLPECREHQLVEENRYDVRTNINKYVPHYKMDIKCNSGS